MFRQNAMVVMMSFLCFGIHGITYPDRMNTPVIKDDTNKDRSACLWIFCKCISKTL